jgi:hypothetical protein
MKIFFRCCFYIDLRNDTPCLFALSVEFDVEDLRGGRKSDDVTAGLSMAFTVVMEAKLEPPPSAKIVLVLVKEVSGVAVGEFGYGAGDCGFDLSTTVGGWGISSV